MISKMHQLLDILETNPDVYALFRHCPYELLRKIRVRKFTDGEFELEQGEIYQYMYIIVDGRANVYSESENGKKYFLCCSQSGDLIGDMALQPHIRCDREQGGRYAILPGDPQRVDRVAEFLENVEFIAFNREHKTMRGTYKGIPVLVTSTGMGGASTGIAVEELARIGVECMIRIGSCGALQPEMQMGDLVILNGAVRDEGTSKSYVDSIFPAVPDPDVLFALRGAAIKEGFAYHVGIGRSHDSFYVDNERDVDHFWSKKGVLAGDMESAALFTIGSLRGIKTGSILNTVALYDGKLEDEINQYVSGENRVTQGEKNEIITALEAIASLEEQRKG